MKLSWSHILVGLQVVFDGRQIHGLLNYLVVLGNAQGHGIDWLAEGPRSPRTFELIQNSDARPEGLVDPFETVALGKISLSIIFLIGCILNFLSHFISSLTAASIQFGRRGGSVVLG